MFEVVEKLEIALRFQEISEDVETLVDYEEMCKTASPSQHCGSQYQLKKLLSNGILINNEKTKQEVRSSFIELGLKMSSANDHAADELVEELNRVCAENKKFTEMFTVMCENYNALQSHMADYMSNNPAPSDSTTNNSTRRKPENPMNQIIEIGNSESSSRDEDSCKKPRQELLEL
ncbi:hypothetical protein L1887_36035 [Cichorium endivia]|nr:hypothetical protein L1887_36035 [Cichorium endivia]